MGNNAKHKQEGSNQATLKKRPQQITLENNNKNKFS
jgi:hypothetical protein